MNPAVHSNADPGGPVLRAIGETGPRPANEPLPAGATLQGYRIVRLLSTGGFSLVYLALDARDRPVAIKEFLPAALALRDPGQVVLRVEPDEQRAFQRGLRSFFEESRSLAAIEHPNVVRVLNFFRDNGTAYLVMRYERGSTLEQCLREGNRPLPESSLRRTFIRLLNGLREVHVRRMLHLDIKPANIYVRVNGVPLLIDFGASRQMLGRGRPGLSPTYTPGFAAPEQHDRGELGPWTDIYSVGASMFACLAGRGPQPAGQRLVHDRNPPARQVGRERYSAELLDIIDWCLELDPAARPRSVLALQKALGAPVTGGDADTGFLGRVQRYLLRRALREPAR